MPRRTGAFLNFFGQIAIILGGAVLGGAVDCPILNIAETIYWINKAIVFGESADVLVEIIDHRGLVDTDGRNIVDPAGEEVFVFGGASVRVHRGASTENEVVNERVGVVREIETG